MNICDTCGAIFKNSVFTTYCDSFGNCPLRECYGYLIEIDENLYEAYKVLNEKGYITRNCCSAHSFSERPKTYIQFSGRYSFPSLPTGFKVEMRNDESGDCITTISKTLNKEMVSTDLQRKIWKTAQDVLNWSEKLECIESD